MTRKDWYTLKAPAIFTQRDFGKTIVNRTAGLKTSTDSLKGRVIEVSLADLNNDEDLFFRKIKLCIEEISGNQCLTNFHGMTFTKDKLCSLVKKWSTLIECWVDCKTTDGYVLRLFCIGFTKRRGSQLKKTSYAQGSQKRKIRAKMAEIMTEASSCELRELFGKFVTGTIGKVRVFFEYYDLYHATHSRTHTHIYLSSQTNPDKNTHTQEIEKACNSIYPLKDVFIRKAKVLKKPKFDITKLMEVHEGSAADTGKKMEREEAEVEETVAGSGGRL